MIDRADPEVAELVARLELQPHPEGGYFREVFRSATRVEPADGRPARNALTTIYFLLARGDHSRWHRVSSDEVWHFYQGDPLELYWVEEDRVQQRILGSGEGDTFRVATVPAGCWQAARPAGRFSLLGCTVGPGFDFSDFEMVEGEPGPGHPLEGIPRLPDGLG